MNISDITNAYIDRINEKEQDVQAFVTLLTDNALEQAKELEDKIKNGEKQGDFTRNSNWNKR